MNHGLDKSEDRKTSLREQATNHEETDGREINQQLNQSRQKHLAVIPRKPIKAKNTIRPFSGQS